MDQAMAGPAQLSRSARVLFLSLTTALKHLQAPSSSPSFAPAGIFDLKSSRRLIHQRLKDMLSVLEGISGTILEQREAEKALLPLFSILRMGNATAGSSDGVLLTQIIREDALACVALIVASCRLYEDGEVARRGDELLQVLIVPLLQMKQAVGALGEANDVQDARRSLGEGMKSRIALAVAAVFASAVPKVTDDEQAHGTGVVPLLLSEAQKTTLACVLGSLLDLAELEQSREVQAEALAAVTAVISACAACGAAGSSALFAFLPGICVTAHRLLVGDDKVGSRVVDAACHMWQTLLLSCLHDKHFSLVVKDMRMESEGGFGSSLLEAEVGGGWKASEEQLRQALQAIPRLRMLFAAVGKRMSNMDHSANWKYVGAVVGFASSLLSGVGYTLQVLEEHLALSQEADADHLPQPTATEELLSCLVLAVDHSFDHIRQTAGEALAAFSAAHAAMAETMLTASLKRLLEARVEDVDSTLDLEKLAQLRLITNHIAILGERMRPLLLTGMEELLLFLMELLVLDTSQASLSQAAFVVPVQGDGGREGEEGEEEEDGISRKLRELRLEARGEASESAAYPKKVYANFRMEEIEAEVKRMCRTVVQHTGAWLLPDRLMETVRMDGHVYRLQAVLLLSFSLEGAEGEDFPSVRLAFLQELLASSAFRSEYEGGRRRERGPGMTSEDMSAREERRRQLLECTMLEAMGVLAVDEGERFRRQLMFVLFPLLKKLGENRGAAVSRYAWVTMTRIAAACGYRDVEMLIASNVDYLVDTVCQEMQHLELYPDTPKALRGILLYSDVSILPMLADAVHSILRGLDQGNRQQTPLLIHALQGVLLLLRRIKEEPEFASVFATEERETAEFPSVSDLGDGDDGAAVEEKKEDEKEEKADVRELTEEEEREILQGEEEEVVVPEAIQLVDGIMRKMQHFLSADRNLAVVTLDILQLAATVMAGNYRKQLMPTVHIIWPALCHRLNDSDPVVVRKTLAVLEVLAGGCGDYFRDKFLRTVWPAMQQVMRVHAPSFAVALVQARATTAPGGEGERDRQLGHRYRHREDFKLLAACLSALAVLCRSSAPLGTSSILRIARAISSFLHDDQVDELRSKAVACISAMQEQDGDAIWLFVSALAPCPQRLSAEGLPAVTLPVSMQCEEAWVPRNKRLKAGYGNKYVRSVRQLQETARALEPEELQRQLDKPVEPVAGFGLA